MGRKLIYLDDAICAIKMLLEQSEDDEHDNTWNNAIRGSINAIKHHVLSAQPDVPDTNVGDYISRQDAIDAIVKQLGIKDESFLTEQEKTIVKVLRGMQSAQPERKTGEWISIFDEDESKCSKCEKEYYYPKTRGYNFCPNCGADMRGKNNG